MISMTCPVCPHHCHLKEGEIGLCRARICQNRQIRPLNYGKITGAALDPIEKKPLKRFYPGSKILSVGSFGCNFHCPFCQNHAISMADIDHAETVEITPEELVQKALDTKKYGNLGIAYTYNEPIVGYEFVRDCSQLARKSGLKNVLVTNGYACPPVWQELLKDMDAVNLDLKAFHSDFYKRIGGDIDTIKQNLITAAPRCHIEVTTLIIPHENDSLAEMEALSSWLASVNPQIPLHITRFFPCWNMTDRDPTSISSINELVQTAKQHLMYVYAGNC